MIKRVAFIVLSLFCSFSISAQKVSFITQWTPQSQFAGFYLAEDLGFYDEEGLDVQISNVGLNSSQNVMTCLANGTADFVGQQLPQSIIARSDGVRLVNVMQLTQQTGLCCVSHNPISSITDLDGKRVARWRTGSSELCEIAELVNNITIDWVLFLNDAIPLYIFGAVDAMLCYCYSELVNLKLAVGDIPEENIIRFASTEMNCPEDGLYVTEEYYNNNKNTVDKFVRASKKGWDYAREHPDEALAASSRYMHANQINRNFVKEKLMLEEYLQLQVNPETGKADYSAVPRSTFYSLVEKMLNSGSITRKIEYDEIIK